MFRVFTSSALCTNVLQDDMNQNLARSFVVVVAAVVVAVVGIMLRVNKVGHVSQENMHAVTCWVQNPHYSPEKGYVPVFVLNTVDEPVFNGDTVTLHAPSTGGVEDVVMHLGGATCVSLRTLAVSAPVPTPAPTPAPIALPTLSDAGPALKK